MSPAACWKETMMTAGKREAVNSLCGRPETQTGDAGRLDALTVLLGNWPVVIYWKTHLLKMKKTKQIFIELLLFCRDE